MKSIAVIMPFYFNYENIIKINLEKRGYKVYLINDNWDELSFVNHLNNVYFQENAKTKKEEYYILQIKKLPEKLDYILIITGRSLSPNILKKIRKKYICSQIIMYQWDGVAQAPQAKYIAEYCNKCFTFDISDANKFGWIYRPLFFDDSFKKTKKQYDLAFICSIHSERIKLFHQLERVCQDKNLNMYDYMYCDLTRYIRQRYLKKNPEFNISPQKLKFSKLPFNKTVEIYNRTKCLVDYKYPTQTGFTMRTIESIGYRTKIITNNKEIVNQDFYDPHNVYIYDIDNFEIPDKFLEGTYFELDKEIYYKYSINGWIDDIIGGICGKDC